jgi:3-hydroxyisobutyrate dehydrogenase-like beta-hydroxyacid dehydrogenase
MTHSAVGSPMLQARAALLRELPDNAWFDVAMMQKDLRLALDYGADEGLPMPSTTIADQMLSTARKAGYEHRDIAVMFRVLSDLVAAPPGGPPGSAAV